MLGFYPVAGAPLADTGAGTLALTLTASQPVMAIRSLMISMVRAAGLSMAGNVLRILPLGVMATASMSATAASIRGYTRSLDAMQSVMATASRLALLALSAVAPLSASLVRLMLMVRMASSTVIGSAYTATLKVLYATAITAIAFIDKIAIRTLPASAHVYASLSRLLSRSMSASIAASATRAMLNITAALARKSYALFVSRVATKPFESRSSTRES